MKKNKLNNSTKKKLKKVIEHGIFHVQATFNNTIVTLTDPDGNVLTSSSAGMLKFKGSKKSTAFAAQVTASICAKQSLNFQMKTAEVRVKGPGLGKESSIRAIKSVGINILTIKDVTPIPHNGCRPKKKRRV